jgi:hypothetical protein
LYMYASINVIEESLVAPNHGKGRLSLKSRLLNEQARRVELGVIVCAEYRYDKIRPA